MPVTLQRRIARVLTPPPLEGARLILYAGQPQGDAIVSHGPFIGDSKDDIVRLYGEYRAGGFGKLSELAHQPLRDA